MIRHATASAVILRAGHVLLPESKGIGFTYPGGHVDNEVPAANGGKAAARKVSFSPRPA